MDKLREVIKLWLANCADGDMIDSIDIDHLIQSLLSSFDIVEKGKGMLFPDGTVILPRGEWERIKKMEKVVEAVRAFVESNDDRRLNMAPYLGGLKDALKEVGE